MFLVNDLRGSVRFLVRKSRTPARGPKHPFMSDPRLREKVFHPSATFLQPAVLTTAYMSGASELRAQAAGQVAVKLAERQRRSGLPTDFGVASAQREDLEWLSEVPRCEIRMLGN